MPNSAYIPTMQSQTLYNASGITTGTSLGTNAAVSTFSLQVTLAPTVTALVVTLMGTNGVVDITTGQQLWAPLGVTWTLGTQANGDIISLSNLKVVGVRGDITTYTGSGYVSANIAS